MEKLYQDWNSPNYFRADISIVVIIIFHGILPGEASG